MDELPLLDQLIDLQLGTLAVPTTRLCLMSVTAATVRFANLRAAVEAAAARLDVVGVLSDGSMGVLSVRDRAADGGVVIEERFLPRLRTALLASSHRRADSRINLRFRAVHRRAVELMGAQDLIRALAVTPARAIALVPPAMAVAQMGRRAYER